MPSVILKMIVLILIQIHHMKILSLCF